MPVDILVAEIGSTVTKVHAFDQLETDRPLHLGSGSAPTTVASGDVTEGLRRATRNLSLHLGRPMDCRRMLAASSAGGGLRMTVHGLVRDMTVRAAREAALGAGAIVDLVTVGGLDPRDLDEIRRLGPDIILLAGGVEDGDTEVILHNARSIASLRLGVPVIYAGNSAAREECAAVLARAGYKVRAVGNVYPRLDQLDTEPARRAIQEAFEERIAEAPGMEKVRETVEGTIRPTPGAVLQSARVLRDIIGDLVVVDVGGATTDVHSVTDGSEEIRRIQLHAEPTAKRTVEGDLGVYVNAAHVVDLVGEDVVAEYLEELSRGRREAAGSPSAPTAGGPRSGDRLARVRELLARLQPLEPGRTPPETSLLVEALARIAGEVALYRHAGSLRYLFGPTGRVTVAEGKDLTEVWWVIGTGGPLTRFPGGLSTLAGLGGAGEDQGGEGHLGRIRAAAWVRAAAAGGGRAAPPAHPLLPGREARPLLDRAYVMAALGVLHHDYPEAAAVLLRRAFPVKRRRM